MYDKLGRRGESYQMPETAEDAMELLLSTAVLNDDQWAAVKQFPSLLVKSSTVFGENGGRADGRTIDHNYSTTTGAQ